MTARDPIPMHLRLERGDQIPVATSIARKLHTMREQVIKLAAQARSAGLNHHALQLDSVHQHMCEIDNDLEQKARNTFVAARRGEEV